MADVSQHCPNCELQAAEIERLRVEWSISEERLVLEVNALRLECKSLRSRLDGAVEYVEEIKRLHATKKIPILVDIGELFSRLREDDDE